MTLSFLQSLSAFLFALFAGISFGSLLKIFLPVKKSARFSPFGPLCFFLSLSVVCYTILIFSSHSLFPFQILSQNHADFGFSGTSYYFILFSVGILGILISLFWKIAVPVSIFAFVSLSFFTFHILKLNFASQERIVPVKIEENRILVKNQPIKIDDDETPVLKISVFHIPDSIFLPVPRTYHKIEGFQEENSSSPQKFLKNPLVSFYLNEILLKKSPEQKEIPLPQDGIVPSLYHLDFSDFSLKRDL